MRRPASASSPRRAALTWLTGLLVGLGGTLVVLLGPAAPAQAAACDVYEGVTVVAEFNQLGGGVQGTCVEGGGGRTADRLFQQAGLPLRYASRQPGFVCRVKGVPTSDPCVNTAPEDAYWGLWWSTGDPGASWRYSSLGVMSLKVPEGGLVAFAWDERSGNVRPRAAATRPASAQPTAEPEPELTKAPEPTREPDPTKAAEPTETAEPESPTDSPTESTEPTTSPAAEPRGDRPRRRDQDLATPTPRARPSASETPSEPETSSTSPELVEPDQVPASSEAAEPGGEGQGGLPTWVPIVALGLLFSGAGAAAALRRRTRSS